MQHDNSRYPGDWLRLAEKDFKRVERLIEQDDPELAGFCLQQAVEKFLKAFLLSQGWQLRRIHNLDALLDDALIYDNSLESFRNVCQKITAFYIVERYPLVAEGSVTVEDVGSCLRQVTGLIETVRAKLSAE